MEDGEVIVFKIGDQYYGIDVKYVQAAEKVTGITYIPNVASHLKGIINLRGTLYPVYSLRRKFGLEDINPKETQLLLIKLPTLNIGIEIDAMDVIQRLDEKDIFDVPSVIKSVKETRYFGEVINLKDKLVLVIDPNLLLTEEELKAANTLVEQAEE